MQIFESPKHAASWAGLCPGNHESGGKRLSNRTRKGSRWLRHALCRAAWAATRKRNVSAGLLPAQGQQTRNPQSHRGRSSPPPHHRLFASCATEPLTRSSAAITSTASIPNARATGSSEDCSGSVSKFRSAPSPCCRLPRSPHRRTKRGGPANAPNAQFHANTAGNNQEFSKDRAE